MISLYVKKMFAKEIVSIIKEYRVEKQLEYFVSNNAINNNTCIKLIFAII